MTPRSSLQLSPFYWDLRNKIIRPWESVGQLVSRYFWRQWQPILGPEYTVLVIELRQLAADAAVEGGTSSSPVVQVSHQDLAERTGLSLRKVQRLLSPSTMRRPENWFLGRFIRVENRYVYDEALGKKIRVANSYAVAIDDPLHPEDEEGLSLQVARREQDDLRAQGFEAALPQPELAFESSLPSSLPPASPDEERLYQLARDLVPELSLTVLARLLGSVGPETVMRQLEWFPLRDNSWARNGPAAAFFTYCKEDRPPPPAVIRASREAEHQEEVAQRASEAAVKALEDAPDPESQPEVWKQILARLPTVSRFGLGPRLEFLRVEEGRVFCRCPTSGDAFLLRQNQRTWDNAASEALGSPTVVVVEAAHDKETSTCAR